jgi:hypothetical protein
MPPKRKNVSKINSQSKLKYINTCVSNLIESLPRQTFDLLTLSEFETNAPCSVLNIRDDNHRKKKAKTTNISCELSSKQPIQINDFFLAIIPRHPNINVRCAFCGISVPSVSTTFVGQPQARKRYTPICDPCNGTNVNTTRASSAVSASV